MFNSIYNFLFYFKETDFLEPFLMKGKTFFKEYCTKCTFFTVFLMMILLENGDKFAWILRVKTKVNKLMNMPNNVTQNYPFLLITNSG